jgi:hypothetical protein
MRSAPSGPGGVPLASRLIARCNATSGGGNRGWGTGLPSKGLDLSQCSKSWLCTGHSGHSEPT